MSIQVNLLKAPNSDVDVMLKSMLMTTFDVDDALDSNMDDHTPGVIGTREVYK